MDIRNNPIIFNQYLASLKDNYYYCLLKLSTPEVPRIVLSSNPEYLQDALIFLEFEGTFETEMSSQDEPWFVNLLTYIPEHRLLAHWGRLGAAQPLFTYDVDGTTIYQMADRSKNGTGYEVVKFGNASPISEETWQNMVNKCFDTTLYQSKGYAPKSESLSCPVLQVRTAGSDLNFRSGPGTNYSVIGEIPNESLVICIADAGNGFYKINYLGKVGYVSSKYLAAGNSCHRGDDRDSIFPDVSSRYLTDCEVKLLSKSELQNEINNLYARHHYIFKDQSLNSYYSQSSWYSGKYSDPDVVFASFNAYEKANVNLLTQYQ